MLREIERAVRWRLTNICLEVGPGLRGPDVHAMAPGVVELLQFHEVKHLCYLNLSFMNKFMLDW